MITTSSTALSNGQQFSDHVLFFGSTGLIGSLTLQELLKVNLYLCNEQDLQLKLNSCNCSDTRHFILNKNFYCINRRLSDENYTYKNDYVFEKLKTKPLTYNGDEYVLQSNTSSSPPASQSSNASLINNLSQQDGKITIGPTVDTYEVTLDYRLRKQSYQLEYRSKEKRILLITFHFTVIQLVFADSARWGELLSCIFSGEVQLTPSIGYDNSEKLILPHLDKVPTMICTLGSNSTRAKRGKTSRYFVDYKLSFQLVQNFTSCEGKRLIIITTFNNTLISHIFPYFKTKSKLERDLQEKLTPKLQRIIVLRPGPLVGKHGNQNERNVVLYKSPNFARQLLLYKKFCLDYKHALLKEIHKIGFKTKVAEVIARNMYRKPGSWILGYCIPATKTAFATAYMAVDSMSWDEKCSFEIITSEQIDNMI